MKFISSFKYCKTARLLLLAGFIQPISVAAEDDIIVSFSLGYANNDFNASSVAERIASDDADSGDSNDNDISFEIEAIASFGDDVEGYVKTLRTVRSAEVECEAGSDESKNCSAADISGISGDSALSTVRDADAIEAYLGGRYFIGGNANDSSRFYAGLEIGFSQLSENTEEDLADKHKISVGWKVTGGGTYSGSFVDIGYGTNELFVDDDNRFRATVRLNLNDANVVSFFGNQTNVFIESEVDSDSGSGSDSIQTRIGFFVPIGKETDAGS